MNIHSLSSSVNISALLLEKKLVISLSLEINVIKINYIRLPWYTIMIHVNLNDWYTKSWAIPLLSSYYFVHYRSILLLFVLILFLSFSLLLISFNIFSLFPYFFRIFEYYMVSFHLFDFLCFFLQSISICFTCTSVFNAIKIWLNLISCVELLSVQLWALF